MTVKDVMLSPWISEHTIVMINHKRTASRIDVIKGALLRRPDFGLFHLYGIIAVLSPRS